MFTQKNKGLYALLLTLFLFASFSTHAQDAEAIYKSQCATCHTPHKDLTGPKLFEVREKWESDGAPADLIYEWVRDWEAAVESHEYAAQVAEWSPTVMLKYPDLTNEEIDAIFDYVDAQPEGGDTAAAADAGGEELAEMIAISKKPAKKLTWVWFLLAAIVGVVLFSLSAVGRRLKEVNDEIDMDADVKFGSKEWAWKNKKQIGVAGFVVTLALITWGFLGLYNIGITTGYQPSQPIPFPHDIHAGINGIDCMYCHSSANKGQTAGIPTTNTCMNCHKQIQGEGAQVEKIAKIYQSAGFTTDGGGTFSGETENIVWNKVHTLPDYAYFNHAQHVEVGGIDCMQCHGDMTKQNETARVVPVEELNLIEGNVQLTKPTLTMGWCIECHDKKEVSTGTLDEQGGYYEEIHKRLLENDPKLYDEYLKDGKVTVKELGGWECAKCHY